MDAGDVSFYGIRKARPVIGIRNEKFLIIIVSLAIVIICANSSGAIDRGKT